VFFFEKKNQKTFAPGCFTPRGGRSPAIFGSERRVKVSNLEILRLNDVRHPIGTENADLSGSVFSATTLAGSCFSNVTLAGSRFENISLAGISIENATLAGASGQIEFAQRIGYCRQPRGHIGGEMGVGGNIE